MSKMLKCQKCGVVITEDKELFVGCTSGHSWIELPPQEEFFEGKIFDPDLINFGKATSSKIPHFEYIPLCALEDLAQRMELGHQIYRSKAWNAMQNQEALDNKEWVIARLAHVIHHTYKAIQELTSDTNYNDDNAGAILFGGAVLSTYNWRQKWIATTSKKG